MSDSPLMREVLDSNFQKMPKTTSYSEFKAWLETAFPLLSLPESKDRSGEADYAKANSFRYSQRSNRNKVFLKRLNDADFVKAIREWREDHETHIYFADELIAQEIIYRKNLRLLAGERCSFEEEV
jgi:hypothetical protein